MPPRPAGSGSRPSPAPPCHRASWIIERNQSDRMWFFIRDAVVAVVVRRAEAAVDLGGRGRRIRAGGRARRSCPWSRRSWGLTVSGNGVDTCANRRRARGDPVLAARVRARPEGRVLRRRGSGESSTSNRRGSSRRSSVSVDGELAVACVPVSAQLDLKALGKARQARGQGATRQKVTGYVSGGHEPRSASGKRLPTHVDASALEHETILVNGGRRGLQLELDPRDPRAG